MNICFFNLPENPDTGKVKGGKDRATHLLAEELRRRGHSVKFYFEPFRGLRPPLISSFLPPYPFRPSIFPSLSKHYWGIRFRKFLKEHKIDVAVWHGGAQTAMCSLKNLPCKLITMCHAPARQDEQSGAEKTIRRFRIRSRLGQKILRSKPCRSLIGKFYNTYYSRAFHFYAVRHSDRFVMLSERFFPDFAPMKKFSGKIHAIPNIAPYDAQNVSFDDKKKELLWVARMHLGHKRPDFMPKIWQRLQDRFPDWKLRFVGEGDYLPDLKKLSSSLGLKNVFFEGFQDPAPYYRSAPIFCMTSAYEGFPMTLLEAQAFGCVPVAFESFGSVRDIIDDGVNGFLVPPFNLDIYAEKLAQLMSDPELCERLATNAQKSIAKFTPEAIGDKWEKLLKEVQDG